MHVRRYQGALRSVSDIDAGAAGHALLSTADGAGGVVRRLPLLSAVGATACPKVIFSTAHDRYALEAFEAPPASRLAARRRSTGGLGDLGLGEAAARVRRERGWAGREWARFDASMRRLAGGSRRR